MTLSSCGASAPGRKPDVRSRTQPRCDRLPVLQLQHGTVEEACHSAEALTLRVVP